MARSTTEPHISARLLQPFVRLLATSGLVASDELNDLRALSLDDRVSVELAYRLLETAVSLTGDRDLGLKAGRLLDNGVGGPFEYAVRSAPTVSAAIEAGAKFMRLLNDALECRLETDGDRAIVILENTLPTPVAAADFEASALHTAHLKPHLGALPVMEWSFPYPAPENLSEYERTFAPAKLRFGAPYLGYSFDKSHLQSTRETGDTRLHAVLKKHSEALLRELPKQSNFRAVVHSIIVEEDLSIARPNVASVAKRLGISQRTLARRLDAEGTSFSDVLDEHRRSLALDYITRETLELSEIVYQLGFSELATFYRAFKRWTGQTPRQYRRAHRHLAGDATFTPSFRTPPPTQPSRVPGAGADPSDA